jgi:hypothetical protein
METSRLRIYSIGVVAENKKLTTTDGSPDPMVMVTPIEQMTMLDGEIKSEPLSPEATGTDGSGANYTSKVTVDNAVQAKWFPMATNRMTPPDVRRGERVLLWQYGDTDTFYWTELGWDDHLRKLETVRYSFSGTADESVDPTKPENCYFLEVSTHTGLITLKTSKVNKELCAYVLQLNTITGVFIIADDIGNNMHLDSKNTLIEFTNANGTTIQLDKSKIFAHADDTITFDAGNAIYLKAPLIQFDCKNFFVNSSLNNFKTPTSRFSGDVTIGGALTVTGAGTFNGACHFAQPITASGITSTAPIVGPSKTI